MFAKSRHSKNFDDSLNADIEKAEKAVSFFKKDEHFAPHALTPQEVLYGTKTNTQNIEMSGAEPAVSPLQALKEKAIKTANEKKAPKSNPADITVPNTAKPDNPITEKKHDDSETLLEKCMPYITDNGGKASAEKPAYTLQSIDEIINSSGSKAAELLDKLNLMGSVTFDDLSHKQSPTVSADAAKPIAADASPKQKTEEIDMQKTTVLPTISDIDNSDDGKTAGFSPIDAKSSYEDISSGTKIIDLKDELFENDKNPDKRIFTDILTEEPSAEFRVENDYLGYSDAKRVGTQLLHNSRSAGIRLILTLILTGIMASAKIPFIHDALYTNQSFFSLISAAIFFVICLVNYDVFTALKSLSKPQKLPESTVAITSFAAIFYTVYALIKSLNPYNLLLFTSVTYLIKCLAVCMRNSYILGNFRIIATKKEKYAIKFIDDRQITFAMAKNNVEGDALVGLGVKSENIQEFLKHTYIDADMNGALGTFIAVSVIISFCAAAVFGIYNHSFTSAVLVLNVLLGFAFSPTLLFTDVLPLKRANSKLNKTGAMIAGSNAARDIERANAVAVSSLDLFPRGTVTLYSMQALDKNNIDRTILDAAAVAKQIDSPVFYILEDIAKTGYKDIPIADSIKYEDRMGISGWVDNRHVFIGNRTLLEAHGISVPPIEVDKKILRNGYFPVYIASNDKPCALLIVQYNAEERITEELQKLTSGGVVVLVDSCDPNLTGEMICDYFGLYEGSAYVMGNSGSQLYKNAASPEAGVSAGAAFRPANANIFKIFNRAAKIKRTVTSLSVFHIIAAVIMSVVYVYSSFINGITPLDSGIIFIYPVISLVISYIISLFNK